MSARIFGQRRAAFNPIAVIAVQNAVDELQFGVMDVAGNHAVNTAPLASRATACSKFEMNEAAFFTLCLRNADSDQ
jgi:hypothetical protein